VIIGSGEMRPQMARVHRAVIARLAAARRGGQVRAAILDTPYGFQENADSLGADALDFFGRRLGMDASLASLRRADEDAVVKETAYARIREADFVFSGPGSPSYALGHWSATEVPTLFADKLLSGGALVVASAAALTLGRVTAPIYEIFKAGEDPRWLPGLDVLSVVGINAAVVPHWDNNEGSGHDTRYCFLGERRFARLEREVPDDTFVLGIDEHTALLIDLETRHATVHGRSSVTIRQGGHETVFRNGADVPIDEFSNIATPHALSTRRAGDGAEANLAARVVALEDSAARLNSRAALVEPLVEELLLLRAQARQMAAYEVADQIRDVLTGLRIEVTDAADGTTEFHLRD
jgi:cyanophycinase-like exopeptidase